MAADLAFLCCGIVVGFVAAFFAFMVVVGEAVSRAWDKAFAGD